MNKNKRCKFCNWLNKEVRETFVCKNCGKENEFVKIEEKTHKELKRR